jgi:hypothetical protein
MVEFVDGTDTITLLDNGTAVCSNGNCTLWGVTNSPSDTVSAVGKISVNNEDGVHYFDGWSFQFSATSGSPGCTPSSQCATDTDISVTASAGATSPLVTYFADSGFTSEPGFVTSLTQSLDSTGTSATSSYYAYTGALQLGAPPAGDKIGSTLSVACASGPCTSTSTGGGSNPVSGTFNLQDMVSLTATGGGQNFTVTSTIDAVPEPASVALFGTVLALCAFRLRRRRVS